MYFLRADYVGAIDITRECIRNMTVHAGDVAVNPRYLIDNYFNLLFYYGALGRTADKMDAIDSCIANGIRLNRLDIYSISALGERITWLFDAGAYGQCIDYASTGEALISRYLHGEDSLKYSCNFFIRRVNAMIILKDLIPAGQLVQQKLKDVGPAESIFTANLYALLAKVSEEKTEFNLACSWYRKALSINLQNHYRKGCSECLNDIGYLYADRFKLYDKALREYREALFYGDFSDSLNVLTNIAGIYVHQHRFDLASRYFQAAFDQLKPGMTDKDLLRVPVTDQIKDVAKYVIGLILDKGDAGLQEYMDTRQKPTALEALNTYKTCDLFLDRMRVEQGDERSGLFWRSDVRRLYEHAIDLCYRLGMPEEAFYFIEKSKAVLLADKLTLQSRSSNEAILHRAQLSGAIRTLEGEQSAAAITAARNSEIQKELLKARHEMYSEEQNIRKNHPLYYQTFLDTAFITLRQAQSKLLNDHQALVELFTGDSTDYCLIVTPANVLLTRIDKADLDTTVNRFMSYISDPAALNRHFPEYTAAASHLYHLLFSHDTLPNGRVIVSPDDRWFPFEALISQMTAPGPRYFLADHAVSYAYSFRYLQSAGINIERQKPADPSAKTFLGVAPVEYKSPLHLQPLKGSETSLRRIAADFPGSDHLIAGSATRTNFLHAFCHYSVIQLYTHAATGSGENDDPVIYFADSALYLSDLIPETKPVTKLIILSACETGSGKLHQGEGVFSFNRGFAALGIPSSIANLWTVDDQSTYRLTELFYRYLTKGLPADQALQRAKLDFIGDRSGEKSLPYYWAAPVVAGDGAFTVTESSIWPGWSLMIEILLVAVVALLILKRRNHR
jgi:CHAT domain-containing protein